MKDAATKYTMHDRENTGAMTLMCHYMHSNRMIHSKFCFLFYQVKVFSSNLKYALKCDVK